MVAAPVRTTAGLSVEERAAHGRAARADVPRSSHAEFAPSSTRQDPVALLERQSRTRLAELVPIRYGRMLVSPFTFYRGAAAVMANDLAATPRSGLTVQCCGDAHLANFGVYGSPERKLVFDVNDFDETLPGPWEWDVKRLAASLLIAAADNGFAAKHEDKVVLDAVGAYRAAMREFAGMSTLDVWYSRLDIDDAVAELRRQLKPKAVAMTEKELDKARTHDNVQALSKLCEVVDGEVRIVDRSPLIVPLSKLAPASASEAIVEDLRRLLRVYQDTLEVDRRTLLERFELHDVARKVVGVGSVGTRDWIALLLARGGRDPLFLQIKEADASVLEPLLRPSPFGNHGKRVIAGQRLMQAVSGIFLGWLHDKGGLDDSSHDYYVRQLKNWKGSAAIDRMNPNAMSAYGKLCGWTLARAHARSGDPIAIGAYLGGGDVFDRAILEFSKAYAEQNQRDYDALAQAAQSGRVSAQRGV